MVFDAPCWGGRGPKKQPTMLVVIRETLEKSKHLRTNSRLLSSVESALFCLDVSWWNCTSPVRPAVSTSVLQSARGYICHFGILRKSTALSHRSRCEFHMSHRRAPAYCIRAGILSIASPQWHAARRFGLVVDGDRKLSGSLYDSTRIHAKTLKYAVLL